MQGDRTTEYHIVGGAGVAAEGGDARPVVGDGDVSVSYTHLTLPTSDLV